MRARELDGEEGMHQTEAERFERWQQMLENGYRRPAIALFNVRRSEHRPRVAETHRIGREVDGCLATGDRKVPVTTDAEHAAFGPRNEAEKPTIRGDFSDSVRLVECGEAGREFARVSSGQTDNPVGHAE